MNKQDWIDDYRSQATNLCQAKITEVVHLSPEDYQTFIYSFLSDQPWLAGKGGSGSHYVSEKYGNDWDKLFCDELEAKKWRCECYEISLLVTDGKQYVLANPEGYNYARYVGLEHLATLKWVLEKCSIQLTEILTKDITINQAEMTAQSHPEEKSKLLAINSCVVTDKYRIKVTDIRSETVTGQLLDDQDNLILEYEHPVYVCVRKSEIIFSLNQSQPEQELMPQPEPDTAPDWMKLYQEWVATLVSQNRYTEIQSYEDWHFIESEQKALEDEKAALESEMATRTWQLNQRLLELQVGRLKRNSNK